MSERIQRQRGTSSQHDEATEPFATKQERADDLEALLDEIDLVLESDAEEYVKGFVQKGGQ